jgi:hypothetical protein
VITFDDICAVIVTRGDVDLEPILSTLPYAETVVWDNSQKEREWRCYGRYLAVAETDKPVIYFQDDDLIFTAHQQLLERFRPDRMVVNMPSPWYEIAQYDKLGQALVGAGSLVPRGLPFPALRRYLSVYPVDELFLNYADVVVGMLTPFERVDLGYEVLDYASAPGRIWTQPGAAERKQTMQQRVNEMREAVAA